MTEIDPSSDLSKMPPAVCLSDVQGNILKGFCKPNLRLIFFKFGENVEETKGWLHDLAARIPNTLELIKASEELKTRWDADPAYKPQQTWIHVGLSKTGIEALGLTLPRSMNIYEGFGKGAKISNPDPNDKDAINQAQIGDPFFTGMKSRGETLGDLEESSSENWSEPYKSSTIDAVVVAAGDQEDDLDNTVVRLTHEALIRGNNCVGLEIGKALLNSQGKQVEHFGFRDGISQPLVRGVDRYSKNPNIDEFDPECFVTFGLQGNLSWANNGSFMVFRKLEQNVSAFWEFMRKNCIKLNKSPEELAALIVGRWKSGAPLAKHHTSDPVGQEFADENDFQYRETIVDSGSIRTLDSDGDGVNTPKFSHVRLANPRDDSRRPDLEKPSHNRTVNAENRILRRGIPYGMALADDPDNKNGGRGILFICYQRDLWKQFEFIQSNWFNSNNYPEDEGPHADVIKLLRGDVGYSKLGLERFVTTKGGAYFFSPSISALKNLKRDFSTQ